MGFSNTRDFLDQICRDSFGDSITITPNDGGEVFSVNGIYVRKQLEEDEGYININQSIEYVEVLADDVRGLIKNGYSITAEGNTFTLKNIKPPLNDKSIEWVILELE